MNENTIFKNIKVLIFDVDGVFTNNQILFTDDGHFLRSLNARDGYAIKQALNVGLKIAVITGGTSIGVEKWFRSLQIDLVYTGIQDKGKVFKQILQEQNWVAEEILYIGDDIPDRDCISMAGVGVCPADAVKEVLAVSDFISPKNGGDHCVRDLIERILIARQQWDTTTTR